MHTKAYTRYFVYIFLFFSFLGKGVWLKAQAPWGKVYVFPHEKRLRLNLEIGANLHLTKAMAFTAKKSLYLKDGGQANSGWGMEVFAQHRFRKNALWAVGALAGYQNLDFENKVAIMNKFSPIENTIGFYGNSRTATYLMPNIAFRGGVKWKFELMLALGIGIVNGGGEKEELWLLKNTNSENIMHYTLKEWTHKASLSTGYRLGASIGYLFKKRYLLAAQIAMLNLSGSATAKMREANHIWNIDLAQIQRTLDDGVYNVKQKIKYQSYFFGLTLKYQIYKTLYPHTITKNGIIYH